MSEVQERPSASRSRGSTRGGRGGYGSRGGRRGHATNGDNSESATATSIEESTEVVLLKKQFGGKVGTIKEMFPEWTDEDVVFALQETEGDLETTVERITDGSIAQWGAVSKAKKDRSRSKAKDGTTSALGDASNGTKVARSGRTGHDAGRGSRGRGTERDRSRGESGRGGRSRGAAAHTNGTRAKDSAHLSVPTEDSSAWDASKGADAADTSKASDNTATTKAASESWTGAAVDAVSSKVGAVVSATSKVIPSVSGAKKSWAGLFEPPPVPKKAPTPPEKTSEKAIATPELVAEVEPTPPPIEPIPSEINTPTDVSAFEEAADVSLTPSKDELTESNVEQVLDTSNPAPTATAASTAASSWDPRSGVNSGTPQSALQQPPQAVRPPPASGYVATALKATGPTGRSASYQRRVLDQEEAVRMPGNREVDRAAVQFGAFNLGESAEDDVDGDREEPETRAQPPQHSPVAHPRTTLPPAPPQSTVIQEDVPSPKEAPGLPAATHTISAPGLPSPLPGAQSMAQQGSQGSQQYSQYGRYPQTGAADQSSFGQKSYDPFSQQASTTQTQYENYPGQQAQPQPQQPQQPQQQPAAFSSAPTEFSSYYTADPQRNAYQNYYGQPYGHQQGAQAQQDGQASQQRSYGGYNNSQPEPSTQSRYPAAGEAQTSGHTTPNPPTQSQQQPGQGNQSQQNHPGQQQGQPGAQYPYGHPYYSSPYYAAYMNQYQQQGYGQGNYAGGPYGAKGGMYSQPHQGYGMSQNPYDHTASSGGGPFGGSNLHGRDTGVSGGLNDYGRTGSQPGQTSGASGAFGGMQDAFGRGSTYQGQQFNQQGSQQATGDDLKPFGEGKSANGPSPSLSQAARPGSAANSNPGQSALPPPQNSQQGYGGYPTHLQQQHGLQGGQTGSQYGGLGGLGGHQATGQAHQSSQYSGYGQGFGNSYYGNNQQQRGGGWGNNYPQH